MGASGKTDPGDFAARVDRALTALAGDRQPQRILVSYSGGLDSSLLLHCLRCSRPAAALVAVHFDHGLHPDSVRWRAHCRAEAETLGVAFIERRLELAIAPGDSVEAVAREARYAALADIAGADDIVTTAHHADDQLETVLLRLLRGTGVRGLTAIYAQSHCGPALLLRPLLEFTRKEIEIEARRLGIAWIEDPSNADTRFDRNHLRRHCLPPLQARWPAAGLAAGRLARQMAETEGLLAEIAAADLGPVAASAGPIPLALLAGKSDARVANALRQALAMRGLPLPSAAQLAELQRALGARADAAPLVRWPGVEARVYRQQLYLAGQSELGAGGTAAAGEAPFASPGHIAVDSVSRLSAGELRLVPASDGIGIPDRWARAGLDIAFRHGGERIRPHGHRQHKTLKHWFQEAGILPWMRDHVPLLYRDDKLIAIADLCLSDDLPSTPADAPFWRPAWTNHPPLR